MKKNNEFSIRKTGIAGAFALAAIMIPATATQTAANDVGADIRHTFMCMGLLLSDPDAHLFECGVGDYSPGTLAPVGAGDPPLAVVQEEEEEEEESVEGDAP